MVAMSRKTFTVTAERGRGPWWVTECAEAGCVSQVRRLDQVADDIRANYRPEPKKRRRPASFVDPARRGPGGDTPGCA